jgi:hypothetical protein
MKLIVTIDTEEDNWGRYRETCYTCKNIERIRPLQQLFDEFNVKPTYLITYPVATDERSVSLLKGIADSGRCEIGTHCHPWNTPPIEEKRTPKNSMLCNLPPDLQYRKIQTLHRTIKKNFNVSAVSFRAGRWGFNAVVGHNLIKLRYRIDSSVTAYTDWSMYDGPDFSNISPWPYLLKTSGNFKDSINAHLAELPATAGYLQSSFALCNLGDRVFSGKPWNRLKVSGVLKRLHLLNKVSLSPELATSGDMIQLAKILIKKQFGFLNMFFHSTSLTAGPGPFVKTKQDEVTFFTRIRDFLDFTAKNGIESVKLSEVPACIKPQVQNTSGSGFHKDATDRN